VAGDGCLPGIKKTLLIRQKSFQYFFVDIIKLGSDLSVPIFHRDGVGTLLSACYLLRDAASAGCQGFFGPFPSAFLDKRCNKNCPKGKIILLKLQNFFFWENTPAYLHFFNVSSSSLIPTPLTVQ